MSTAESAEVEAVVLSERPHFELEFLYDDPSAPTEVTIFEPETLQRGATEWLTIDHEHAVPLQETR